MAERKATAVRAARLGAGAFARLSAEERRRVVAAETARLKSLQEEERQARVRERQRGEEFEARQEERKFQRGVTTRREAREAGGPQITPFQQESLRLREQEQERFGRERQITQKRQAIDDTRRQIMSTYADPLDAQEALTSFYEQAGVWTPEVAKAQRKANAKARIERDQEQIQERAGREASVLEEIARARTPEEGMRIFEANEQLLSPQARQKTIADLMERQARAVEKARFAWEQHPSYAGLSQRAKQLFIESVPEGGPQTAVEVTKLAQAAVKAERAERRELRGEAIEAKKRAAKAPTRAQREKIAAIKSMFSRGLVPDEDFEPVEIQEGEDRYLAMLAAIEQAKLSPEHFAEELAQVGGAEAPGAQGAPPPGYVRVIDPQGRPGILPLENLEAAQRAGFRRAD